MQTNYIYILKTTISKRQRASPRRRVAEKPQKTKTYSSI